MSQEGDVGTDGAPLSDAEPTEPDAQPDGSEAVTLATLPDDALSRVWIALLPDVRAVFQCAATCRHLQFGLGLDEPCWKEIFERRWPLAARRHWGAADAGTWPGSSMAPVLDRSWRTRCRTRAAQAGPPDLCNWYDECLMMAQLPEIYRERRAGPALRDGVREALAAHFVGLGRLARLISTHHAEQKAASPLSTLETMAWVVEMSDPATGGLARPIALYLEQARGVSRPSKPGPNGNERALLLFGTSLDAACSEWFATVEQGAPSLPLLLQVYTGRSALEWIFTLPTGWARDELAHVSLADEIDRSLGGLRAEGCDLSVPWHSRPTTVPKEHWWWWLEPPVYVSGGNPAVNLSV